MNESIYKECKKSDATFSKRIKSNNYQIFVQAVKERHVVLLNILKKHNVPWMEYDHFCRHTHNPNLTKLEIN